MRNTAHPEAQGLTYRPTGKGAMGPERERLCSLLPEAKGQLDLLDSSPLDTSDQEQKTDILKKILGPTGK